MKIRLLFIALVFIFFSSCSKDDDKTQNVILINPEKASIQNPCCINFQWQNPEAGNSRIMVSKNQNFTDLLLDTIIAANSFSFNNTLQPNTEYFWKVSNGTSESQSYFKIKDVLTGFKPDYPNTKIRRYTWDQVNGYKINHDTTFYKTIKLTKEGDKVRFELQDGNYNFNRLLSIQQMNSNGILYYLPTGTYGCSLELNYVTDSISIRESNGGLGGGMVWEMKLKK